MFNVIQETSPPFLDALRPFAPVAVKKNIVRERYGGGPRDRATTRIIQYFS
jgi:hypothetical protein